jgi:hypothetical protein
MRTVEISDREIQAPGFGRRSSPSAAAIAAPSTLASDLRLFALTFAGGFLFMTVYLV